MLEFRTLKITDADKFRAKLTDKNLGWEYNFATVFLWNVHDSMQIAETDNALFLYNKVFGRDIFMPPAYQIWFEKFLALRTKGGDGIQEADF